MRRMTLPVITALILFSSVLIAQVNAETVIVNNPYEVVRWDNCQYHKANLHTHTKNSDGALPPSEVITGYDERDYDILAITDHNHFTWPWGEWDRDPEELGMIAVRGCEPSRHHHMNSFFCDYDGAEGDIEDSLSIVEDKGGLAQLNHPGRYSKDISWYKRLLDKYEILLSVEVYNQGDRYSGDRKFWDKLLTETMPERPVWGTSNDDMHGRGHMGRNWQVMLLPEGKLSRKMFRTAYKKGVFYACYDKSGEGENVVLPQSIKTKGRRIVVDADCDEEDIRWISEGDEVARGAALSLDAEKDLGSYVRVVIHGENGARTLLQPIGLREN